MSVSAFKPLRDRQRAREPWSPEDRETFGAVATLLNDHRIAVRMWCRHTGCPSPALIARPAADGVVLRCGCTDRVLAGPAMALTDEGRRGH